MPASASPSATLASASRTSSSSETTFAATAPRIRAVRAVSLAIRQTDSRAYRPREPLIGPGQAEFPPYRDRPRSRYRRVAGGRHDSQAVTNERHWFTGDELGLDGRVHLAVLAEAKTSAWAPSSSCVTSTCEPPKLYVIERLGVALPDLLDRLECVGQRGSGEDRQIAAPGRKCNWVLRRGDGIPTGLASVAAGA